MNSRWISASSDVLLLPKGNSQATRSFYNGDSKGCHILDASWFWLTAPVMKGCQIFNRENLKSVCIEGSNSRITACSHTTDKYTDFLKTRLFHSDQQPFYHNARPHMGSIFWAHLKPQFPVLDHPSAFPLRSVNVTIVLLKVA